LIRLPNLNRKLKSDQIAQFDQSVEVALEQIAQFDPSVEV